MPDSPNKLSNLWQELKRRNVTRVLAVYIAAAFMLLELVDMISEPFGLPEGSMKVTFFILLVGLVIAVIDSWIYDIHPEGGLVKTEPANQIKTEDITKSSNSWKIASYISFVVIVALIVLNIIPRAKQSEEITILDKSIAVLPFINDSPDDENTYFINGTMEAILDNLSKIEDLRVLSRTSVEQYRNAQKSIPEIAKEMDVSYILEGSGQKDGNKVRLTLQLIDGISDKHLWSSPYTREIEVGQIFDLQSEIAQLVAAEIKAIITPEEKQLIEKIPTTNLTAYEYYLRGKDFYADFLLDRANKSALENAIVSYQTALEIDSTFALAYAGLAIAHHSKYFTSTYQAYSDSYFEGEFLDSVLLLADLALSFDDNLEEAYHLKGLYDLENGNLKEALENYETALAINPNNATILRHAGSLYSQLNDYVNALSNFHKAASIDRSNLLPILQVRLSFTYWQVGFFDKAKSHAQEYLKLTGDSVQYNIILWLSEFCLGNEEKAFEYARVAYAIDSTIPQAILYFGAANLYTKHYQEAYKYYSKYYELLNESDALDVENMQRMGHALWEIGKKDEARYYFNESIRYSKTSIRLKRQNSRKSSTYDLAGVYFFLGDKELAYKYLEELSKTYWNMFLVFWIKQDPMFDSVREEERFQKVVQFMDEKYQAEHERVRQWLEENDML